MIGFAMSMPVAAQETPSEAPQQKEIDKWRVGIRMGAVASDMLYTSSAYNIYSHKPYARGTIGFQAERDLIAGLSIRPELSFTGSGVRLKADDIKYGLFLRTFDIRAGLLYTFLRDKKVQPYVLFSPSLNIVMNGRVTYSDATQDMSAKLTKSLIYPVNFSMLFGGGVRIPLQIKDFPFYVNAEMGYNIGCVNTFSKMERNGTASPMNGIYSGIEGSRLSSTFELAASVSIPLSSFRPKREDGQETWLEQRQRERRERKAAQEEQARQQAELLRMLQEQQAASTNAYNEDLANYNAKLAPQNRVGEGIKMYVVPNVALETADDGTQEMNLKLEFAYETTPSKSISFNQNTDDYPAGAYMPTQSKACKATLGFMKEQLDGELRKYFTPDTRVTIRITGETDGSPIKGKIPYKGEFGEFEHELIYLNGVIDEMTVTRQTGITANGQLGFLRTQGVRNFIETYVDALQATQNTYQIYAVERTEKGSQYRKISVELTIHNAYGNELRQIEKAQEQVEGALAQQPAQEKPKPVVSDVDTNIPSTGRNNEDTYVFIVGNEHYKDIVGIVPFAENDAKIFRQYCISTLGVPERQIRVTVDATRNEITDGMDWLDNIAKARQGKAKIIFYYAGHGVPVKEMTYLLPVDANPEKADQQISLNTVYERLSDMNAASVTCLFDACFSGTRRNGQPILQGGRGIAVKPKFTSIHGNLVIFSAATAEQTAYPFAEQKHGLFTYWLLKALQESNGTMSYQKLIAYLTERVALEASLMNREQMPTLQYSESLGENWFDWTF